MRSRAVLVVMSIAIGACSRSREVTSLRDALASGDASRVASAVEGAPSCAGPAGTPATGACLSQMADWFGARAGFHAEGADQASAAVAALSIARDGRGDALPSPEAWLLALRLGEGPGADALRLAVTARMATDAVPLAHPLAADADARALMKAVAASVPGACDTYALLGAGGDNDALPPPKRAEHSPCVQKDLERVTGPSEHGRYGFGVWRGAEGALALWRDVAAALHGGIPKTAPATATAVTARLATIDTAIDKIALKTLPPTPDPLKYMQDSHESGPRAHVDAGLDASP